MGNPTIEMVRTSAHSPIHVPKRGSFGCVLSGWLRLFLDRIPQALLAATYRACPEMTLSRLCRNYRPSFQAIARLHAVRVRYPLDCQRYPTMVPYCQGPRARLKILVSAVQSRPCPPPDF